MIRRVRRLVAFGLPLGLGLGLGLLAAAPVDAQPVPDGSGGTSADAGVDGPGDDASSDATPPDTPDAVEACLKSFARSQALRRDSRLIEARAELVRCGQASCPNIVRTQCGVWLTELDAALPSVVVVAADAAGNDAVDVRLGVDGTLVRERLDGLPVPLDPGVHELSFTLEGHEPLARRIVVVQGEKDRKIKVKFARRGAPPAANRADGGSPVLEPASDDTGPVLAWTGFGIAGTAAVIGTVTGIVALVGGAALRKECPDDVCSSDKQAEIDRGMAIAHASTASFAVAGAGLLVGFVGLFIDPEHTIPPDAPQESGPGATPARARPVVVRPLIGCGTFGLSGQF